MIEQRVCQDIKSDGFGNMSIHAGIEADLTIAGHGVSRHRDDGKAAAGGTVGTSRLEAIHDRHLDIHQDQIEFHLAQLKKGECGAAIANENDRMAELFEQPLDEFLIRDVILSGEDAQGRALDALRKIDESVGDWFHAGREGDGEPKRTSLPFCAFDADFAPQESDQLTADGEPETGAAIAAGNGTIHLTEGLEDFEQFALGDANASIGDGKAKDQRVGE